MPIPTIRTILLSFVIAWCIMIVYSFYKENKILSNLPNKNEIIEKPSKKQLNILPIYKEKTLIAINK